MHGFERAEWHQNKDPLPTSLSDLHGPLLHGESFFQMKYVCNAYNLIHIYEKNEWKTQHPAGIIKLDRLD